MRPCPCSNKNGTNDRDYDAEIIINEKEKNVFALLFFFVANGGTAMLSAAIGSVSRSFVVGYALRSICSHLTSTSIHFISNCRIITE